MHRKQYAGPRRGSNDVVNIRTVATSEQSCNTTNQITNLGTLTTSNSGIWALNSQISSLSDMFRLFKIKSVVFEFAPEYTTSSAATNVPAGQLAFSMSGQTAPTGYATIETPHVSNMSTAWGAVSTNGTPEALLKESKAILKLREGDFAILQGPSGPGEKGYLATQDDGTQTSYGTLFWNFLVSTASATVVYYLRSYLDLDFKDILDPQTISAIQAQKARSAVEYHVSLAVHHQALGINFAPGTLERAIKMHMCVPRLTSGSSHVPGCQCDQCLKKQRMGITLPSSS